MSTGLDRIELDKFARTALGFSHWPEQAFPRISKSRFVWLPLAVLAAVGGLLTLSADRGRVATGEPAQPASTAIHAPAPPAMTAEPSPQEGTFDPSTAEAITPEQPSPLDKLKLYAQSWHRGGLGSNALVTFTLRNYNAYPVKDIQIACAFARRDGRHLTDRTRLVPGTIAMRSRKTFARLHVGFVNINAKKAKCALVSAAKA